MIERILPETIYPTCAAVRAGDFVLCLVKPPARTALVSKRVINAKVEIEALAYSPK